jgi:hypothetical protein
MPKPKPSQDEKSDYDEPISLAPLTLEEALKGYSGSSPTTRKIPKRG